MPNKDTFLSGLSLNIFGQGAVAVINILLLKILSAEIPEEGVGIYIIIRRLIALSFPVITFNLSISLARFVSLNEKNANQYFYQSWLILTILSLGTMMSLPLLESYLADWIFGSGEYAVLMLPIVVFLYSNSFQVLCMGYFRGKQNYLIMNIVNVLFWLNALFMLSLIFFIREDYIQFLYQYFLYYALFSFLSNILIMLKYGELKTVLGGALKRVVLQIDRKFIKYGISRLPSGFFMAILFFTPIIVASNSLSLKVAAYIGIVVSIVRLIQSIGQPFSIIFLPKFSAYQASGDDLKIKDHSQLILEFIFTLPFLFGVIFAFFSAELILLWFGPKYELVILQLMIVGPFIGLFMGFVLIRGILDGFSDYPYVNIITFNAMIAVVGLSIVSQIYAWGLTGLTIALSAGLFLLGVTAIYILVTRQKLALFNSKNILAFAWFLLVLTLLYSLREFLPADSLLWSITIKTIISLAVVLFSYFVYKYLQYRWFAELIVRLKIMLNRV